MSSWTNFLKRTKGRYTPEELKAIKKKHFTKHGALKDIVLGERKETNEEELKMSEKRSLENEVGYAAYQAYCSDRGIMPGPYTEAMKRALTCQCGHVYETEDGDGECPRCAEMDEIETNVEKLLNDLRPRHLEDDDVRSAAEEGAWKYLRKKNSDTQSSKTCNKP